MNYFKIIGIACGVFVSSGAFALDIVKTENNSFSLEGNLVIPFNNLEGMPANNYLRSNDFGSDLKFMFSNKLLPTTEVKAIIDLGLNTLANNNNNSSSVVYNRYAYIEFLNQDLGSLQIGKVRSAVRDYTVGLTNRNSIVALDAGYGYSNSDIDGVNYATKALDKAAVYLQKSGNFTTIFQFQSTDDNLMARDLSECSGCININYNDDYSINTAFKRKYSVGGALNYNNGFFSMGAGFESVNNRLEQASPTINSNNIDATSYLLGMGLNFTSMYFALAGGYYQNLKLAGVNHLGLSSVLEFKLRNITPYIGYQVLYSPDASLYNTPDTPKYSMDENYFLIGMRYNPTTALTLGIEYDNDIRSEAQATDSLLNTSINKITTVYLKYNF